jgi:hypothetical protein
MSARPIVLIHGYSDRGTSFRRWRDALLEEGEMLSIHTCNYETLTNEVTIRDIAEGFDRELNARTGIGSNGTFDAIVHSTGMLVLRSWLAADPRSRLGRLKHLIALAPASFGSPLAHKGRSWVGSIFKGRKEFGPDFLEAGDSVLSGLELASSFTWELAHRDMLGDMPYYTDAPDDTYVFTFCGREPYKGLRSIANEEGTDGTVRWAGCPLNSRKFVLDLTHGDETERRRCYVQPIKNARDLPVTFVPEVNHSSILSNPPADLIHLVKAAMRVENDNQWRAWLAEAAQLSARASAGIERYQQFVVRATDERGDGILDYNLELSGCRADSRESIIEFDVDVHAFSGDPSLRCFHVNLSRLVPDELSKLQLHLTASTGTQLVTYNGYGAQRYAPPRGGHRAAHRWQGTMDITPALTMMDTKLFCPYTTTLLELQIDREPVGDKVLRFLEA